MYNFLLVFHYKSRSFEFTLLSSACIIVSSRTVSEIFNASNNGTSLKSELEVIQGHFKWQNSIKHITWFLISLPLYVACLGGAVGSVTVRAAWLRWSASPGSRPGLARSLCQVTAAYALRLNSRAGTEGSTVSSLICDRWLILGSETLSTSRCLNQW